MITTFLIMLTALLTRCVTMMEVRGRLKAMMRKKDYLSADWCFLRMIWHRFGGVEAKRGNRSVWFRDETEDM